MKEDIQQKNDTTRKESETCAMVSTALIILGIIIAIAYLINFGKVVDPASFTSNSKWSFGQIFISSGIFLNFAFFSFLISKVGSILESLNK